ncbi:anti-anti-sigma factor [Marinitoga piezophila KA3]|uniref:Anti-sigma factor antagonist n=1 Tax=Marinitoga piezophila (strain DSM 14283 / JCM 11233 / KA3) TaxID=443254 RepID=H2J7R6_MARPK|nr:MULTISPECIES: STAS domain-containing protein [Marinitoga]AEX85407.1 anti-anti-sigma factor [Marinitoga piezophila KA3]
MDFTVDFSEKDSYYLIKVEGEIDAYHSATFKQKVKEKFAEPKFTKFVIDMSAVSYIDSAGLGAVVSLLKEARNLNKELVLAGLQSQVRKIFEMTKLDKIVKIVDTVEEA